MSSDCMLRLRRCFKRAAVECEFDENCGSTLTSKLNRTSRAGLHVQKRFAGYDSNSVVSTKSEEELNRHGEVSKLPPRFATVAGTSMV